MNIICNSCIGARIYELLELEFKNPFMWNVIKYQDFKSLILNYKSINYENYKIGLYENEDGLRVALATFEKDINVYYIHYHQDESYSDIEKKNIDIYSPDIITYASDKIQKRVRRMKDANETPIIIFETRNRPYIDNTIYTDDDIDDFINLDVPYTKVLITSHEQYRNTPDKIKDCYISFFNDRQPNLPPDTVRMAKEAYEKFPDIFK